MFLYRGKSSHKKGAFREVYGEIGSLWSFLKQGTPILALSATVEKKSWEGLVKLLGLHSLQIVDVSISNNKKWFSVQKVKKGQSMFNWLADKIVEHRGNRPKTIIFCWSISDLQYCAKRMQTNFLEIRLLFPRNIVEISSEESWFIGWYFEENSLSDTKIR